MFIMKIYLLVQLDYGEFKDNGFWGYCLNLLKYILLFFVNKCVSLNINIFLLCLFIYISISGYMYVKKVFLEVLIDISISI